MVDPRQRSQRRSAGKRGKSLRPLRNFTLFLDESFDCKEVKDELVKAHIKFVVYSQRFQSSAEDQNVLPLVGKRGWAMLTCDSRNRYRELERKAILLHRVRQFVFSGNLGGPALAILLVRIYPQMRSFARRHERPFVAMVTKSGHIELRMDKNGVIVGSRKK